MEVYKLKPLPKVILTLILLIILGIITYKVFSIETVDKITGATCYGIYPKVCTGTASQYKRAMDK